MKKLLLLSILLLFISCKKNEFENLLTGENKKWCYVNSNKFDKNAKPIYYMKFNKNGKSENRMIRNSERAFEFEKLENNCNWRYYENDSVFEVCGFKFTEYLHYYSHYRIGAFFLGILLVIPLFRKTCIELER